MCVLVVQRLDRFLGGIHSDDDLPSQTTGHSLPIGWLDIVNHGQVARVSLEDVIVLVLYRHLGSLLVRRETLDSVDQIVVEIQLRHVHCLAIHVRHDVNVWGSKCIPA